MDLRLSALWKRIATAIEKQADGRVRPVRPWHELEAPEGEEPQNLDAQDENDESEAEPTEQMSEGRAQPDDSSVESLADSEEGQPVSEESPAMDLGGIEESLLLDPSEKARVVNLFQTWDPAFIAERHDATGLPGKSMKDPKTGKTVTQMTREKTTIVKQKEALQNSLSDVDKRLDDARKSKFPPLAQIKNLEAERDRVIKQMDSFLKKYGPDAAEATRLKELETLSEGMTGAEKKQVAPYEFDKEMATPREDVESEAAALEKADKEFEEAGGLAGQLMSKPGSDLSAEERGNLGVVLQGFRTLLSKPELRGSLEQERRMVQKIISTLRKLTDKFADTIRKDQALKRQVADVATALENAIQREESARQSSWHDNDPLRIAIISRLEQSAGGRSQTLRDRHFGKKPIRTKGPSHPGSLPDLSTGVSGYNPTNAAERLISDGPAREIFLDAVNEAFKLVAGDEPGGEPQANEILAAAAEKAWPVLEEQFKELMGGAGEAYMGTLTKEHVSYDPESGTDVPEKPLDPARFKSMFMKDFLSAASTAINVAIGSYLPEGSMEYEPGGAPKVHDDVFAPAPVEDAEGNLVEDPDAEAAGRSKYEEYAHTTGVQPFIQERTMEHMRGMEEALEGVTFNEETGQYELEPEKPSAESRPLSEEEKAARTKDLRELREKMAAPLTRDVLFRDDGTVRDVKELVVSLDAGRQAELRNIIEDEIDSLEGKKDINADEKEVLDQMKGNLEQLNRIVSGRVKSRVKQLQSK